MRRRQGGTMVSCSIAWWRSVECLSMFFGMWSLAIMRLVGKGAATGAWRNLAAGSNAIASGSAVAMTLTTTAAVALPTISSALAHRMPSRLSRGFSCCRASCGAGWRRSAPGGEEKYDNETAVVVVWSSMFLTQRWLLLMHGAIIFPCVYHHELLCYKCRHIAA